MNCFQHIARLRDICEMQAIRVTGALFRDRRRSTRDGMDGFEASAHCSSDCQSVSLRDQEQTRK